MNASVRRLVVFAPNWLGDAIMSLPAIADLRRSMPERSVAVAARPTIAPLFGLVPGIDQVVAIEKQGWDASPALSSFEAALLLPNSFHVALVAARAGIPERWGYRTDWRRPLLTRAIDPPAGQHQVDYYQQLTCALGFPSGPAEPRIVLSPELSEAGARALTSAGWDGRTPLVAMAPGTAYGTARRWPAPSFAGLARSLADDGIRSVLVGSQADAPIGQEIEASAGGAPMLNLMGTDLPTLAATLSSCRALVSNDSGAMHLGAALGVSVTAVFGPTDERLTGPRGDRHTVLAHQVWCRPCMLRECPYDHECMKGVGVDMVVDAVRRTL